MEKGKYLRLKAQKEASKNFVRGTIRLAIIGLSGFFGVVYLILWISPLVTGKIEIRPTEISIDQIETNGFPDAEHLTVKDAYPVFSEANIQVKNKGTEISYVTVPVVSRSLFEKWNAQKEHKEPIDASRFRLFAVFNSEQVTHFWPDAKLLADNKESQKQASAPITITGDTGPAAYWFYKPMKSGFPKKNLDWKKVRCLKLEEHVHSLGRNVKHFIYAGLFLALSLFVISLHLKKRHGPIPDGTPDPLIAQTDLFSDDNAESEFDMD